ncbi:hypothetical protein PF005_g33639 [Phytophthora fragariae]|uniref:Uncharacterized protein n=1 Tax=Phytophthora fragariae TaxID=53985 RepID=A0A6A3U504_9STRA|nr:hypothetical protein PF005_g33639 [Phytophthora fragariae]KAE9280265.1 hypothetical protein PF008_g28177 [Phytophthora fragariae]
MCDDMKITSSSYKSSQETLRTFDSVRGLIAGLVLPAVRWHHGFLFYPVLYWYQAALMSLLGSLQQKVPSSLLGLAELPG